MHKYSRGFDIEKYVNLSDLSGSRGTFFFIFYSEIPSR